jgi:hypothetical protein
MIRIVCLCTVKTTSQLEVSSIRVLFCFIRASFAQVTPFKAEVNKRLSTYATKDSK